MSESKSRYDTSLRQLAVRFASLLQNAKGRVLDLKLAADVLKVRKMRRIYDITSVLEGVGLIEKLTNFVIWKGPGSASAEAAERSSELKNEISQLEELEKQLDAQVRWAIDSVMNILECNENIPYIYVTAKDILQLFEDSTVIVLQGGNDAIVNAHFAGYVEQGDDNIVHVLAGTEPVAALLLTSEKLMDDEASENEVSAVQHNGTAIKSDALKAEQTETKMEAEVFSVEDLKFNPEELIIDTGEFVHHL